MGQYTIYIIIGVIVVVLYVAWMIYANKKHGGFVNKWLKEHPDAIKVMTFNAGMTYGFYLTPGKHIIEATCTTQRPGVMYRNVFTTYGPVKLEVEVIEGKEYTFTFDKKKEEFFLEEK